VRKNLKSLRDARHLDKYIYTLSNSLFYEPLELHYKPLPEYRTIVSNVLKEVGKEWMISPDGFWCHIHPEKCTWPVQGWKTHVSATLANSPLILKKAASIALKNDIPFKFASDRNILGMMNIKRWRRGGSGKFITMYPPDLPSFTHLMEQLYQELRDEEGPYILSDKRYKDCRALYYRYGGMSRTALMEITGEKVLCLISPEGKAIPDIRTPYFAPPAWAEDPFPTPKQERREITLNNGRYLIKRAIAFSNSGGVYIAEDRETNKDVVIKEARPHTVQDTLNNDAVKRLKKEYDILQMFRETGISPQPVELFQEWENFFLVEEFIEGEDLRNFILGQTPLMRVNPSLEDSRKYYEAFTKILSSFIQVVDMLHQHGVVFGDLSPNNIKVDPETYKVRLIDFESAMRIGLDDPTYLYTPGFKNPASIRDNGQSFEDDRYGLAAIMLYMLFPIAAIAALRNDLFDAILEILVTDIGWSQTEILQIITGMAKNEISCTDAHERLNRPAPILPPSFAEDAHLDVCRKTVEDLGSFILANIRPEREDGLFPADPFIHQTNPLSLAFGACGILYSLKKCGLEVPQPAHDWLERNLNKVKAEEFPPGLLTGASGIAWALGELGLEENAARFITIANESPILTKHHSYFYGMAGTGMANLYMYARTGKPEYLQFANNLADTLLKTAQENDRGLYWESDNLVHIGYGYGQSGVAFFLLRLHQLSGKEDLLSLGKRALEFDLSYQVASETGAISFPHTTSESTLLPYLEEGCAGIARVAMRYGIWDKIDMMLAELHRKYAGFPGLLFGLGSFVEVLTDAYLLSGNEKYLAMAKRPISGIRSLYLLKQQNGVAVPGDGLFRISCDYATGVAGVMRTLHRFVHLEQADFTLDSLAVRTKVPEKIQNLQASA
jgi:serine/threonine protein kinase